LEIFMKKILSVLAISMMLVAGYADAKGGGSSGGHGGGGGGGRSSGGFSSSGSGGSRPNVAAAPSRPSAAPATAPAPAAPQTRTTTTTSTTTTRTAGGGMVGGGMMYGGMGMGFGYTNGLLTGLIIGNMMHPHNTVVYNGGGYSGNALLYPDGRVVNQQGYQVGTYQNGQFNSVNGGMVAQPAPADALNHAPQVAQPVIIQKTGPSAGEIIGMILLGVMIVLLVIILIGML
jgi:hypothetical protein